MSNFGGSGGGLGTISGSITISASGVTSGVSQANNSLATLEKAVAQNWWGLKNLGLAFAALPAAVAVGAAAAVHSAADIQDAMVDVSRTTDIFGGQLETLQAQLFAIASTRATPTLEILGIAESAGALGVAQDDIAQFTQTVVDMASTTDVSSQNAATGLARLAGLTGTTAGGFDNLASSIFATGVSTAATETDVLAMSQRLAGIGAVAGLSANEIIGWSGAILSAGVRTQEGATQFQKTIVDIQRAISTGGSTLEGWARIAGMSADEFKAAWGQDANATILRVVQGLASMIQGGKDVTGALDAVGVKEQRQIKLLELLGQAQAQNANENLKATNILGIAAQGYENTERFQSAVERRNKTFNASLQELQNTLQQTGAAFGSTLLGPMTSVIKALQALALGFGLIDGPAKAIGIAFLAVVTIASALAAAFFLLGPRIIIAWDALNRVAASAAGATGGLAGLVGATAEASGAEGEFSVVTANANRLLLGQQSAALAAAQVIAFLAGQAGNGAVLIEEFNAAQQASIATSETLSIWMRRLANVTTVAMGVFIAFTTYSYALGKAQQDLEAAQQKAQAANSDLTAEMRRTNAAVNDQTTAVLQGLPAYEQAAASAQNLGISQAQLLAIIQGSAGAQEWQQFLDTVDAKQGKGSESANELIRTVYNLRQTWKNSAGDAGVATGAIANQSDAMSQLGEDTTQTQQQLEEFRQKQIDIAQATVDFIDADLGARSAALDLADAEDKLAQAQDKAAHASEYEAAAQLKIQQAMYDHAKAAADVARAEADVASAAQRQQEAVAEADKNLADARDARLNSLDKVSELEKALNDLRNNGAETAAKITDAENKLGDARLKLQHDTLNVRDLEENLEYLREQGAGTRDLTEAELALAQARQDQSDAAQGVSDAEKNLNDLTDPVKRANDIAKAERDLAAARRDADAASRKILDDERALAQARQDAANNTLLIQAESDLVSAQEQELSTAQDLRDAQLELQQIRNGSLQREAQRAELDYERALVNTAKANAEVQKQTALMNGETWDAGRSAHALADELGKLATNTDQATAARERWIESLKKAPNIPAKPSGGTGPSGDTSGFGDGISGLGGDGGIGLPPDALPKAHASFLDFLKAAVSGGGAFLLSQLAIQFGGGLFRKIFTKEAIDDATTGATESLATVGADAAPGLEAGLAGGLEGGGLEAAAGPALAGGMEAAAGTAGIAAGPVLIIALAAAALIALTVYFWPEISGFFSRLGSSLAENAPKWFDRFLQFFKELPGKIVGFMASNIPTLLQTLLIGPFLSQGDNFIGQINEKFTTFFMDTLPNMLAYALGFILGMFVNLMFVQPIEAAINYGPQLVEAVLKAFYYLNVQLPIQLAGLAIQFGVWLAGLLWQALQWGAQFIPTILGFFVQLATDPLSILAPLGSNLWNVLSSVGTSAFNGLVSTGAAVIDWFSGLGDKIYNFVKDLPGKVLGWFSDIGHSLWDGFHDAIFGSPKTKIEYTLEDINDAMVNTVANMKVSLQDLNGLNVDPFGSAAASIVSGAKMVKSTLSDFGAQVGLDPFAGSLALSPGVVSAGTTVNNTYNDNLSQEIHSEADPDQIVNSWTWARRVKTRR